MTLPEAERAWALAKSKPSEGLRLATSLLTRSDDDRATTVALAARGRARFELGDNDLAVGDLRRALERADGPFRVRVAMTLAAAVAAGGDNDEAIALVNRAIEDGGVTASNGDHASAALRDEEPSSPDGERGVVLGLALSQLGFLQMHAGDLAAATTALARSIGLLDEKDDERDSLARAVLNLGYCELMLGRLNRAVDLFDRAIALGRETSQDMVVAAGLQNQAYALTSLGEFPEALTQLERARELYDQIGEASRNLSTLHDDMAETYRLAGLTRDAIVHAEQALASVEGRGNLEKEADARYRLAVCLLDDGDHDRAAREAERARSMFESAGRSTWETRATLTSLEATAAGGTADHERFIAQAERTVRQLETSGWSTEALRLRNRALLVCLTADDVANADRFLVAPSSDDDRSSGRTDRGDQSVVAVLEGLLHRAIAELPGQAGVGAPLSEANATLQAHRRRLADPELRAGAGRLTEAFRFVALERALVDRDPVDVLLAEEHWRAASLRLPPARPPADPAVAEMTRELRDLTRQEAEADRPDPDLVRRVRRLEDRLRRASHQASATAEAEPLDPTTEVGWRTGTGPEHLPSELERQLGHRRLVEWFEHRDRLHAVAIESGKADLWEVGPVQELQAIANRLRRDLTRLLLLPDIADTTRRWWALTERAADLGQRLLGPAWHGPGQILCPPGSLVELPWVLMTPEQAGPITISFSASTWLGPDLDIDDPTVEVVIGPDLDHATGDHRALQDRFPSATIAEHGRRADLDRALARADVLHVAAHGGFRSDNPMFSSLRLGDGDFALHELAGVDRVPRVVALAACDAGRSLHLEEGNEQLGTAPAWLGAGVQTVVAPICAVPDAMTAILFDRFYRSLPGSTTAEALAETWRLLANEHPQLAGTAAAFLCFGNGGPRIGERPTARLTARPPADS